MVKEEKFVLVSLWKLINQTIYKNHVIYFFLMLRKKI